MPRRDDVIDAVLENPGDDGACLAFADWLDEHAQSLPAAERPPVAARAEFIRLRVRTGTLPEGPEKTEQHERALGLFDQHFHSWLGSTGYYYDAYPRGFLHMPLSDEQFEQIVPAALMVEPVFATVQGRKWSPRETEATAHFLARLKSDPRLRTVISLGACDLKLGASGIAQVFGSPFLKNLNSVSIYGDSIGLEGVRAIAESPAPFRLGGLCLERVFRRTSPRAAVEYIAQCPRFAHLKQLALPCNGLNDRCVEALIASKTLPSTMKLYIHHNHYDEAAFAAQLAQRFGRIA